MGYRTYKKAYFLVVSAVLFCYTPNWGQQIEQIQSEFQKGNLTETVLLGKQLLEQEPNHLLANHLIGRALTDLGKYNEAKRYLTASCNPSASSWMIAWSHGYLGTCYFMTDSLTLAQQHLEKAIRLKATKNSTAFAKKSQKQFQFSPYFNSWETVETATLRFHFQPGHRIKNLQDYCQSRQEAFDTINLFFEAKLSKKIDYFIWSKPKQGKKIIGSNIGFANSELCLINAQIRQSRGHELTHILCKQGLSPILKNRFINEGVAVAFDLSERNRVEEAIKVNKKNWHIKELMDQANELPESELYPIAGAFIEYLLKQKGEPALKRVLINQSWETLMEVYGKELILKFEKAIQIEE
ncbi:MAG: hypothetical protein R2792_18340 [Saprospiraceae bacterium]